MHIIEQDNLPGTFFEAFKERDFNKMKDCYSSDIAYFDPIYNMLKGKEVMLMWKLRYAGLDSFSLQWKNITDAGDGYFTVEYSIHYNSPNSGKPIIENRKAYLRIIDDKITEHSDGFSMHELCKQEFGFSGWLIGWNRMYQNRIKLNERKKLLNLLQEQL
jgi:ketosteroid isomerase-like protein